MIVAIGEAFVDTHGFGGCGWDTVVASATAGSSSAFISPISADMSGRAMVEELVERQILFDPDLCGNEAPSMTQETVDGTAPMHVDAAKLLSALRVNSDIRLIHIGSVTMQRKNPSETILSVLDRYEPRPVIALEPMIRAAEVKNRQETVRCLSEAMSRSDILIAQDADLSFLGMGWEEIQRKYGLHVVVNGIWHGRGGIRVCSAMPRDLRVYAGTLLSGMHEAGLFGHDGCKPSFCWNSEVVVTAMGRAAEAVHAERNEA